MKNKKYIRKTFKLGIILFLVYWFISLVHVWHLTVLYTGEFREIIEKDYDHTRYWPLHRVRVLEFSDDFAIVYYTVIRGWHETTVDSSRHFRPRTQLGGDILHFRKINEQWEIVLWDTIWARTGSADDFIWPLIR